MSGTEPSRARPEGTTESVWDYPRPPRVEPTAAHIEVRLNGVTVADTTAAQRVLETSQPPTYYLPADDVDRSLLERSTTVTFCEWKGLASYVSVRVGDRLVVDGGWTYREPHPAFEAIRDHVAFYAQRMDECLVDGEAVRANEGQFYGGWITSNVVGPFKGGPGTAHW